MKLGKPIKKRERDSVAPSQTILGMLVMAHELDLITEVRANPPTVWVQFIDGATLIIDRSLNTTWAGKRSANRKRLNDVVAQARDDMRPNGRLLPYAKLLGLICDVLERAAVAELAQQHQSGRPTQWVRPNSWGFLERRLARSAQG